MKKVLIITYYWPPASSPGVQRWLKFAKYLPQYGWQPVILTVEGGSFPAMDEKLLEEVADDVQVYRSKTWEPFRIYNRLRGKKGNQVEVGGGAFTADKSIMRRIGTYVRSNYFIPDARVGWNKSAIKKANEIIRSENINCVVTTSPPHSSQLIGLALKEQNDIKWLADLRDPWVSMMYNQFLTRTKASSAKDQAYEDKVLRTADHVTVVGHSYKKEFSDRAKKMSVITNGYDQSDLSKVDALSDPFEQFTLFFMGNFLSQQSIQSFWSALHNLNNSNPEFSNSFRMLMIGNISEVVLQDIKKYQLTNLIAIESFQPHDEVIRKMKKSHLLYLPIPDAPGNEMITPGKIFEYLASKLPVLSVGPENCDVDNILKECSRKPCIEFTDETSMVSRISAAWESWKDNKQQVFHDNDLHLKYERSTLTKKMAETMDAL